MNFTPGGSWMYAMAGPDGSRHWCRADYHSIDPEKSFTGLDAFCDEAGNINMELPRTQWKVNFREKEDHTIVVIETTYEKTEYLEQILSMGFKEGFLAALSNLDEMFSKN